MSQNINFITPTTLKSRTGISNGIDDKQIKPVIKLAQDIFLQPALGSALYLRLQSGVENSNLSTNESTLLNVYVTDCLVWATMAQLPVMISYQFFSKGVLQKTSEESNNPSKNDLNYITQTYQDNAEFYKQRLINYLRTNYSLYAEYTDSSCDWDVIKPVTNGYDCPIYLGDDECVTSGTGTSTTPVTTAGPFLEIYISAGNESTFTVAALSGKTLVGATRGGLAKLLTESVTTDTNYLQRVGTTITLPTGDLTQANEIFTFLYR